MQIYIYNIDIVRGWVEQQLHTINKKLFENESSFLFHPLPEE